MPQIEFTFINSAGDPALPHQQNYDLPTIRSHAMREVRRRRRVASGSLTPPNTDRRQPVTTKDYRISSLATHLYQNQVLHYGRSFSGTFCGTAIDLQNFSDDVPRHLYHFLYGFTPLTFPTSHVSYQCGIFQLASHQGGAALLHALCAVGTIHRALIQHPTTPSHSSIIIDATSEVETAFRFHKQHAITSLRKSLSKQADPHSPHLIAITTLLMIIETLSGDVAVANIHRDGLAHMTKRRGGFLQSSDSLAPDVLMADIKSATSSLSRPSVALTEAWDSDFDTLRRLPFVPHRPDLTSLGSGFMAIAVSQHLGSELLQVISAMRNLISAVEQDFDLGMGVSGIGGAHFLVLEHQLLSIPIDDGANNVSDNSLAECCRIGALLYCNLCLWSWPKNATLVKNLLSYLRTAILKWTRQVDHHQQHSLLLWLYVMGSFASSGAENFEWFFGGLHDISKQLDIKDEDGYRRILSKFFYVDRLMGSHLRDCCARLSPAA